MKKFIDSLSNALRGLRLALATQRHLRFHAGVTMVVVVAGIYLSITPAEWGLVVLAIGLVITSELVNTAIETVVDLIEPRQHPLAGKAKDIAAGAVFVAACTAVVIGVFVFYKYLPL